MSPIRSEKHPPHNRYDLIVVGAGSGGFGAALAAARLGCEVLLVEKTDFLGGTAAHGGVNTWEPGVGGTGIPFDLYKRLRQIPDAIGVYSFGRHMAWEAADRHPRYPGGELVIDPSKRYLDTLRRHGAPTDFREEKFRRKHWHGVPFEPGLYSDEMEAMLAETGCCTVRKRTSCTDVVVSDRRIVGLKLDNSESVTSDWFVDATASVQLARHAGCATSLGQEPRSLYGEASAPRVLSDKLNGASLIYRITPTDSPGVEPLPDDIPVRCWWHENFPAAACTQYPNGDYNINSLPTISGCEVIRLGPKAAYAECLRRIRAHWHDMQVSYPEFQGYRISWVAPTLGVREGPRIVGRYVLTEHDLDAGLAGQTHADIITIADHAKDTHGQDTGRAGAPELTAPYGVPFRCLLPREIDNLVVACRGASFSSIAASSCRLSRTMMQLGQAAGTAAALATRAHLLSLADLPAETLRASLAAQHVELVWPRPAAMTHYLAEEDLSASNLRVPTTA